MLPSGQKVEIHNIDSMLCISTFCPLGIRDYTNPAPQMKLRTNLQYKETRRILLDDESLDE